ncbi:MAG: DUF4010 domain-containing protein [Terriglobia bacterium]
MELTNTLQHLCIALGLGLIVGLQREHVASRLAGIRTFPMVTILGTVCAMLGQSLGGWLVALGLLSLAGMIIVGNVAELRGESPDPGLTTEVSMLLMYAVGAYLVVGHTEVAIAIGGGVAVLLQAKDPMHRLTAKLGDEDLKAIMQFALLSLVILPVLPNKVYGPYAVLNPYQIWLMVCLIVGISLGGYIVYKFVGEGAGVLLGGVLGGLISSTATTVSYSRRSSESPGISPVASIVIMLASAIVFVRVLLIVGLLSPAFFPIALPPMLIMLSVFLLFSLGIWFWARGERNRMPVQGNPSELGPALWFGFLFALVLLAVAAAKARLGQAGLYFVAGLSGLTDMDAISLSTTQLVNAGRLGMDTGWRVILVAAMSNLVFKAGVILVLGHRQLLTRVGTLYGLSLIAGTLLFFYWPS